MRSSRRLKDGVFWLVCGMAFAVIAAPSVSVLVSVFHQALPVIGWELLLKRTNTSGLQNAILGSLLLLGGVFVMAGTIGVGGGLYLAEFATGRVGALLRFFSEVLAGMPSIVIGYISYLTLVVEFQWGYSLLAAVIALSVLVTPYIVKTTEVSLRQVPTTLREGGAGLGMPQSATLWRILVPTALPGIASGLIVALAISTGELAPLLFTAGFADADPKLQLLHQQVPYLTNVVYTDLSLPGARAHATSAAAALLSLVLLIVLIVAGRLVGNRFRQNTSRMSL